MFSEKSRHDRRSPIGSAPDGLTPAAAADGTSVVGVASATIAIHVDAPAVLLRGRVTALLPILLDRLLLLRVAVLLVLRTAAAILVVVLDHLHFLRGKDHCETPVA